MARSGRSAFDGLAVLPWPMGLAIGIAAYLVIRHALPAWLSGHGPLMDAFAVQSGLLAGLAWVVLGLCTLAAITLFVRAHHHAQAVHIATIGGFTRDAAAFARGKPIELIARPALLAMIRQAQAGHDSAPEPARQNEPTLAPAPLPVSEPPPCARCGAPMVMRRKRISGAFFLGYSDYPH